jgi:hypothetical protein
MCNGGCFRIKLILDLTGHPNIWCKATLKGERCGVTGSQSQGLRTWRGKMNTCKQHPHIRR